MPSKYYAFISYSHKDSDWAKWLQHEFEYYKLPSTFNGRSDVPSTFRPIFRDEDELSGGELKPQISKALADSEFLIVICSPNSAQSKYVNSEIKEFIEIGKARNEDYAKRIFPLIVEGKPHQGGNSNIECFPQILNELKDMYGNEIELIAGNVNATNRDHAFVQILAGTLREKNVQFSELWDRYAEFKLAQEKREREQQLKIYRANARFISEKILKKYYDGDSYICRRALIEMYRNKSNSYPYVGEADKSLRLILERDSTIINIGKHNLSSIALNSRGDRFAISSVNDSTLLFYDIVTSKLISKLEGIRCSCHTKILFSRDDTRIVFSTSQELLIIDSDTMSIYREFKFDLDYDDYIKDYYYDETKLIIYCATSKGLIYEVNLKTDSSQKLFDYNISDIIVSSHKQYVEDSYTNEISLREYIQKCNLINIIVVNGHIICSFNDGKLRIISKQELVPMFKIKKLFKDEVKCLTLSGNHKYIIAASSSEIKRISTTSLMTVETIQFDNLYNDSIEISNVIYDGKMIILAVTDINSLESSVHFYYRNDKKYHFIKHLSINDTSQILTLLCNDEYLIYNTMIGKIKLYGFTEESPTKIQTNNTPYSIIADYSNRENIILSQRNEFSKYFKVSLLNNGIISHRSELIPNTKYGNLQLYDFKDLVNTTLNIKQHKVSITSDKRYCAYVDGNKIVQWDLLNNCRTVKDCLSSNLWFESIMYDDTNSRLITSTQDAIQLWEFPSLEIITAQALPSTVSKNFGTIQLGNDNKLYICGRNGKIYRADRKSFIPDRVFACNEDNADINLMALSSNEFYIAGADRMWGNIFIWETGTGVLVKTLNARNHITAISFSVDDSCLLVGLESNEIYVYDWNTFDQLIESQAIRFSGMSLSDDEKKEFYME